MPIYRLYSILILFFSASWLIIPLQARDSKGRFVVVIDPGHGGHDSGAIGRITNEKTINLNVALQVGKELTRIRPDIIVHYTRSTDVFIGLMERAQKANKLKADLFVSIHTNSAGKRNRSAQGAETYVLGLHRTADNLEVAKKENAAILLEDNYKHKYEGFDPNSSESYIMFEFIQNRHLSNSLRLAREVQQGLIKTGLKDRGVRQAGFLVIRETSMPSILVELGFITNDSDERYLHSAQGVKELGRSIARGISLYEETLSSRSGLHSLASAPSAGSASKKDETAANASGEKMYRIQIHADKRKLKASNPVFKGYKTGLAYYEEGGLYKYTLYETPDLNKAKQLCRELTAVFKGCFVVCFIDGEKQNSFY